MEATTAAGVPTPALVVDLAAADRNIARADEYFAGARTVLRPHFKAHKCTRLLERQRPTRRRVTCATAGEAAVLARAGFDDILVANQVVDPAALRDLAAAAEVAQVTACVDDVAQVELLVALGVPLGVLVEVDVGQRRSGVTPGTGATAALARHVAQEPGLTFRGLQGYEGHAVLLPDRAAREREARRAAQVLEAERETLGDIRCPIVSGGGTGTYDLSTDAGALNEIQAGSYVLMDASYAKLGLPFEQALFCRTTVVSRQGDRVVLDAGLKALSGEYGPPAAVRDDLRVRGLADEHCSCEALPGCPLRVGDVVLLVPGHVDPTLNLHPELHVVDPDGRVQTWPVDARRPARDRA